MMIEINVTLKCEIALHRVVSDTNINALNKLIESKVLIIQNNTDVSSYSASKGSAYPNLAEQ